MSDAETRAEVACCWIAKNPYAWERMEGFMLSECRRGTKNLGRDQMYTLALIHGIDVSLMREWKRDHNMWSVLARIAITQHPELETCIHTKKCDIDSVDLPDVFLRCVGYDLEQA